MDNKYRCINYLEMDQKGIVYDDINFEGLNLTVGAVAPDLINAYGTTTMKIIAFDGNVTLEEVHGGDEIKHPYKNGSDIIAHVHWMPTTTNIGNVEWKLEYIWKNVENESSVMINPSTISVVDASTGVAWQSYAIDIGIIDGTDKRIGSHFSFRLYRDPTSTNDTYPDDAALLSVGIHYQVNSLGSRQVVIK